MSCRLFHARRHYAAARCRPRVTFIRPPSGEPAARRVIRRDGCVATHISTPACRPPITPPFPPALYDNATIHAISRVAAVATCLLTPPGAYASSLCCPIFCHLFIFAYFAADVSFLRAAADGFHMINAIDVAISMPSSFHAIAAFDIASFAGTIYPTGISIFSNISELLSFAVAEAFFATLICRLPDIACCCHAFTISLNYYFIVIITSCFLILPYHLIIAAKIYFHTITSVGIELNMKRRYCLSLFAIF